MSRVQKAVVSLMLSLKPINILDKEPNQLETKTAYIKENDFNKANDIVADIGEEYTPVYSKNFSNEDVLYYLNGKGDKCDQLGNKLIDLTKEEEEPEFDDDVSLVENLIQPRKITTIHL